MNIRTVRFTKALIREWKITTLGVVAYLLTMKISNSDIGVMRWIGEYGGYLVISMVILHLIALFVYPDIHDGDASRKDTVILGEFIDRNFHKCWIAIALFSGSVSIILLIIAILKLLEEPNRFIVSFPYLCLSVFFFGLFYSIKNMRFAKMAMVVGLLGTVITTTICVMVGS
ncbi:hypothetical protein OKZ62_001893 [Vibrio navarrensis]|nr:hypothetical protein [Vibrio navarrensis]